MELEAAARVPRQACAEQLRLYNTAVLRLWPTYTTTAISWAPDKIQDRRGGGVPQIRRQRDAVFLYTAIASAICVSGCGGVRKLCPEVLGDKEVFGQHWPLQQRKQRIFAEDLALAYGC